MWNVFPAKSKLRCTLFFIYPSCLTLASLLRRLSGGRYTPIELCSFVRGHRRKVYMYNLQGKTSMSAAIKAQGLLLLHRYRWILPSIRIHHGWHVFHGGTAVTGVRQSSIIPGLTIPDLPSIFPSTKISSLSSPPNIDENVARCFNNIIDHRDVRKNFTTPLVAVLEISITRKFPK